MWCGVVLKGGGLLELGVVLICGVVLKVGWLFELGVVLKCGVVWC